MTTNSSAQIYLNGGGLEGTRLLNAAYDKENCRYRFPLDFQPSIDGLTAGENAVMRRLICIGSEWFNEILTRLLKAQNFVFCTQKLSHWEVSETKRSRH